MNRPLLGAALLALALAAPSLQASPLLGDAALPAASQRALAAEVRADRGRHPEQFARVYDLVGLRPRVYRTTRARVPSVVGELRAMGAAALLPMLDVLAVSGYPRDLSPAEREVLVLGTLDALGSLRSRRAEPVLRSAFERMTSPEALRSAARGLGALGGDGEVTLLTASARAPGVRQAAALEGLGVSRRSDAAMVIADVLEGATDPAVVMGAARGLAEAGSTWAQTAAGRPASLPLRCHEVLVRAFVRGVASDELQVAIGAVATADTQRLVDAARAGADAATLRRLATLSRIVARRVAR